MENNKKERRFFDQQFKQDAVRMFTEGGKKISEVSRDLGVGLTQLQRWRRQLAGDNVTPSAESAETEKLRKELAQVKEEREILKKALAVFSRRP